MTETLLPIFIKIKNGIIKIHSTYKCGRKVNYKIR